MSSSQGRGAHALFPRPKGEPGDPFVPALHELYLIDTKIFGLGGDPAADRPAVVIAVPPFAGSRSPIHVVTRTSQLRTPGVQHPADPGLGLNKDGVFSDLASVEQQLWRPENVILLGVLENPYRDQVMERFS